jgi:PTH1 family peptidyl-tRNA hydrolase
MAAKLIVGLGNPGTKYTWTRHNVGFMVLDRLAHHEGASLAKKSFAGLYGDVACWGERLHLLKPQTFMNLSGQSVSPALNFHKIHLDDLIVVHDDIDIPFGQIRVKKGGGHGGHNGLRSLMKELGSGEFVRIRVGVGRPPFGDSADYVLSPFSKDEMSQLSELLDHVVDCLHLVVTEGVAKAMTNTNNRTLIS